jgi:hypothetical protein
MVSVQVDLSAKAGEGETDMGSDPGRSSDRNRDFHNLPRVVRGASVRRPTSGSSSLDSALSGGPYQSAIQFAVELSARISYITIILILWSLAISTIIAGRRIL